jgi:hypothetical protein
LVRHVTIFDGAACGWLDHEDPDKANGKVVSVDEFEANPYAHPNCVRSAVPILLDETPIRAQRQQVQKIVRDEDGRAVEVVTEWR